MSLKAKPQTQTSEPKKIILHVETPFEQFCSSIKSEMIEAVKNEDKNVQEKCKHFVNNFRKSLDTYGCSHITLVAVQASPTTFLVGYAACSFGDNFSKKFGVELATKRALVPEKLTYSYGHSSGVLTVEKENDYKQVRENLKEMLNMILLTELRKKADYNINKVNFNKSIYTPAVMYKAMKGLPVNAYIEDYENYVNVSADEILDEENETVEKMAVMLNKFFANGVNNYMNKIGLNTEENETEAISVKENNQS